MDLKVEGTDLQKLLDAAILTSLGTVGQEALVKEVVRHLTTAPNSSFGRDNASPLMIALQNAASGAALRFFQEKMQSDPAFVASLEQLYVDAVAKFLGSDTREKLVCRMAERLSAAFAERY